MSLLKIEPHIVDSLGNFVFGNVTATSFIGDGSQLTGLPASYANTNVANYLPTYTGNVTANNVTANYFIGDGSQLTGLPPSYANANVANYLPTYTGNITANNVTATSFIGDGSQLTGLPPSYTDSNVANYLPNYSGAMTFTVANIHISGGSSGQYLKTNGSGTLSWGTPAGGSGGTSVTISATAPSAPADGEMWFDTTASQLKIFISPTWTPVSTVPSMTYVSRRYVATGTGNTYTVTNGCGVNDVLVFINGVCQMPTYDYTISGTTLTILDEAPTSGTLIQIRELPR